MTKTLRISTVMFAVMAFVALTWMSPSALWAQRPHKEPPKASNAPDDNGGDSAADRPVLRDKTQAQEPVTTLKVNVQLVNLYFNVKDKRGALIPNLKKEDFTVLEDGKPQSIKYFTAESNLPLTLGILVDTSGSQRNVLPMEQAAGSVFLHDVLTPKDMAFLINFDINVELDQDYTSDAGRLAHALDRMTINDGGGGGAGGIAGAGQGTIPVYHPRGTLLYDAVYLAAHEKLSREFGRKAMVLLTDGGDQGSQETLASAIEAAQRSEVIVYVILMADRGLDLMYRGSAGSSMHKLAEATGGRVIDVGNNQKKLREALDQIGIELRSQYMIGYIPENTATNGKYRKVEVKPASSEYKIQVRKGYFAPKE